MANIVNIQNSTVDSPLLQDNGRRIEMFAVDADEDPDNKRISYRWSSKA